MELNLEEIEQRHERTKLIRAAFGGVMSQWFKSSHQDQKAVVARKVEHRIRNPLVPGSSPGHGSKKRILNGNASIHRNRR